jgi:hypothetical protein
MTAERWHPSLPRGVISPFVFDESVKLRRKARHKCLPTESMSNPSQQPVFLKDLRQPFFLKELPSILGDVPPIDVGHLERATRGERRLEYRMLELFDRHVELVLVRMRGASPRWAASLAHTLAGSARKVGARRVAEAAEALERAVVENREPAPALQRLECAVIEARLAICAMLRTRLSSWRPSSPGGQE